MGLPGVFNAIQDGGLGAIAPSGEGVHVVVGVASGGTVGELLGFTDPEAVRPAIGRGPAADAIVDALADGGGVVYFSKATGDTPGAITAGGSNPGTPAVTLTGTPDEALDVVVAIRAGGARGTATFTYSLDGGDTVSAEILTATTYAIPDTSLTLNFPTGTYAANAAYAFAVSAPTASIANLQAAVRTATATGLAFEFVHVAQPGDNTLWSAVDSLMTEAQNEFAYQYAIVQAPAPTSGESVTTWRTRISGYLASFSSKRVCVVAPWGKFVDPVHGRKALRSFSHSLAGERAAGPLAANPGHVARGSVKRLVVVAPFTKSVYGYTTAYTNADATALDQLGFTTVQRHRGRAGMFFTDFHMACAPTSDYFTGNNRAVMDKACTQVRQALLDYVQAGVDPADLNASLADLIAKARAPIRQMRADSQIGSEPIESGGWVSVPPGQDILSAKKLRVRIRLVPLGYLREITMDIGLTNPFLAAVPAAPAAVAA